MHSANSSKSDPSPIYDITPFSLLDYPDHISAIVWFSGCNMRCEYCYNPEIVLSRGSISCETLLEFLRTRQGRLEAVVLSGGEPTLYKGLFDLAQEIKQLGYKIKLDTNGSSTHTLDRLIQHNLLEYVALDFKATRDKYESITHQPLYDNFITSLELLLQSDIPFEVRTTLHSDLLNEEDINAMIHQLAQRGYNAPFYIQNFQASNNLGNLEAPKKEFNRDAIKSPFKIVYR